MEGDWTEVKTKKKKAPSKNLNHGGMATGAQGGKNAKGMLIPGAVSQSRYGGAAAFGNSSYSAAGASASGFGGKKEVINQASAIADYDFGVEEGDNSHVNVEIISHACAMSVKNARINADLTQSQLAKKINEKPSVIVEVENGTCKYSAQLINRIEKAMPGCKIDRARKRTKR